jgi:hypothetical protein
VLGAWGRRLLGLFGLAPEPLSGSCKVCLAESKRDVVPGLHPGITALPMVEVCLAVGLTHASHELAWLCDPHHE